MKTSILLYIATAVLFSTVSCTDCNDPIPNPTPDIPGEQVTVYLPLKVASLERLSDDGITITRAPLESEGMDADGISNIWVFQFSEAATDDGRLLVSPPYYLDESAIQDAVDAWTQKGGISYTKYPHIPIPLIESAPGEVHLVAFAANINSKDFNWNMSAVEGQKNTYADLKKNLFLLDGESRSYGGDSKNLLMSGRVYSAITPDIVLDDNPDNPAQGGNNNEEGIPMYRSLARIELDLSVDASVDFKVLSVQLRNVPQRIDIFDALIARDENLYTDYSLVYPKMPVELIDYDTIYNQTDKAIGLITSGGKSKYVWYVPRNMRGQSMSDSPKTKNTLAPLGSTYIEVVGANGTRNNAGVIYRIYPGLNDINDYTILGNHQYNVKLNINGDDEELKNDSQVEQYARVRMDGNNNSFILNPPMDGMGARVFEIPITQVNRYWRQTWEGYGGLGENTVKSNDEWQVDLLWQDDARMVRSTPDIDTRIWISKARGRGSDEDGYFSIAVPNGAIPGNFSIALRKKEAGSIVDNVLWSWHFWVTDYNPDQYIYHVIPGQKFAYPVAGGQVTRMGGTYWGYDTAGASNRNNWNNYSYNEASTQVYAKSFMMDRNLGTIHAGYTSIKSQGNLTYQFGRKDPFPGNIPLYDINGNTLTPSPTAGFQAQKWTPSNAGGASTDKQVSFKEAVNNPMKFYAGGGSNSWSNEVNTTAVNYAWNDPLTPMVNSVSEGKSIYDPCPPGWKVPESFVWNDIRRDNIYGWTVNNGAHNRGDGFGNFDKGMRYWPNVVSEDGDYPVGGTVFYPAGGYRKCYTNNSYGTWFGEGTEGHMWSSTAYNSVYSAYQLYYYYNSVVTTTTSKSNGNSVRCITMNK